ncbi:DNA invertase Pin-like site-specific DNA recombinase [Kineothrix alysoides]|uniref:DNA invertase Pin-like site-specific DNA recombinase n=1 Tax=Kineothrix alysoides TaxID=1469948 RepID=A0A4R1R4X5_9FIRM|nr:recombinase family protein [Kineothrix alysoides]TCL60543.1 DNA invertase Pin-like site-specific DNA recombinase [Kineothrix alysoides]
MIENEKELGNTKDPKSKIRERYKGVDSDALDVIPAIPKEDFYHTTSAKRVAVYARVSTDDPRQTSSYELQKNHYMDMVSKREDWNLVGIYADEGISGTSLQHRTAFIKMIDDCRARKIDLVVTKSVSRFARNVLDCIGYVRQLAAMQPPIGVFFETENIYTLNPNSEMSLSFISTLAQEESHTKSEIMNASIEMRFKRGIFLTPSLLGYDKDEDGNLIINEEEAKVVRLIFFMYLYGYTCKQIAETLTELGCRTKKGNTSWAVGSILQILQNERHCGDVLSRKTWTPNYLDHKSKKNRQDRNQYLMKNHHESIISRDDFIAVQRLINNAKYGNQKFLPELHVISNGPLRGFVSINPRWAGFKPDDYRDASYSAYDGGIVKFPTAPVEFKAQSGDFDLRGYEIARAQFFDTSNKITVTFSRDTLILATEAIRKIGKDMRIEMLIHPDKLLFAVRSCGTENRNGVQACRLHNDTIVPIPIRGAACLPTLYELLNWKEECKYRVIGVHHQKESENILIFNLQETEILIPNNMLNTGNSETDSNGSLYNGMNPFTRGVKKNILAYPPNWMNGFGKDFYTHAQAKELAEFYGNTTWSASMESKPYKSPDINVTDISIVGQEIHQIINDIKETINE